MGRLWTALAAVVLLGAACQGWSPGGAGPIGHPAGPNELVLRIESGGGLVPPEFLLGQLPQFSVFGDGRVIVPGPQLAIYPGPALPNLITLRLSEAGLQRLLERARAAGLLGADAHYDYPGVADAPTTTFTVVAEGGRHVVSAYALGEAFEDGRLDPAVRRARADLAGFVQQTSDLRSWLADGIVEPETAFQFTGLRVYATPTLPDASGGVERALADWPLSVPLGRFGTPVNAATGTRCGVVQGSELDRLLLAIRNASALTTWRSGGAIYQLVFRPLLPDESGCPTRG